MLFSIRLQLRRKGPNALRVSAEIAEVQKPCRGRRLSSRPRQFHRVAHTHHHQTVGDARALPNALLGNGAAGKRQAHRRAGNVARYNRYSVAVEGKGALPPVLPPRSPAAPALRPVSPLPAPSAHVTRERARVLTHFRDNFTCVKNLSIKKYIHESVIRMNSYWIG